MSSTNKWTSHRSTSSKLSASLFSVAPLVIYRLFMLKAACLCLVGIVDHEQTCLRVFKCIFTDNCHTERADGPLSHVGRGLTGGTL